MKYSALIVAGMLFPGLLFAQALKPEEIYQKLLPSVITLQVENTQGEKFVGAAFLAFRDGVAVTSWHVVSDAARVTAKLADNQTLDVTGVIDRDEKHDLALIGLGSAGHPQAQLCMAAPLVGSRAYAIGAPKGFEFSITDGLISQIQTVDGYSQFQVSCPISGGNSGGPVVNERGEVVGVTSWTKRDAQNLSFATPAKFLAALNPALPVVPWRTVVKAASTVNHPRETTLAVRTANADTSIADLKEILKASAGREVTIVIRRDNEEKKFDVVVPKDLVR